MDKLYLKVIGFHIAINFILDDEDYKFMKEALMDQISYILKNFFINKPNRIDFTIDIVKPNAIQARSDKTGSLYVLLYENQKNKYVVPVQISSYHLRIVIQSVIHKLLAKHNGFVMHSSSVLVGGKAFLFLGESGAGKSTTAKLLNKYYPVVGDDNGIIKKEGGEYYFYSSPLIEKVEWIRRGPERFPIGGFFFLKKDNIFKLDKIYDKKKLINKLVNQLVITDDIDIFVPHIFEFVSGFDDFYYLHFAKDEEKLVKLLKTIQ